jgi:hypothetical protein
VYLPVQQHVAARFATADTAFVERGGDLEPYAAPPYSPPLTSTARLQLQAKQAPPTHFRQT